MVYCGMLSSGYYGNADDGACPEKGSGSDAGTLS